MYQYIAITLMGSIIKSEEHFQMDEEFDNKVGAVQHNEDYGHCVGLLIMTE